jgi:methionyl-tRNA formyltransferase
LKEKTQNKIMQKEAIKVRTIFMGTSEFAAQILESLVETGYDIVSVYAQPDKKVGRKQELKKSAVKLVAEKHGIPVFQPEKLNDPVAVEEVRTQKPDLVIVAAYGKIIPQAILDIPGFGAINVHGSLLPKYRGPSPIQNAILNGEVETGITIMVMDAGIDTGDILSQKKVKIASDDNTSSLSNKLAIAGAELLIKTIPAWVKREISAKKQDNLKATLCQLIEKSDGKILWSDGAEEIYNRYRAFFPWPGIHTYWENDESIRRIKLNKITCMKGNPETKHHIGEVFEIGDKIGVQAGLGVIILEEVQIEGRANMKMADFINGYKDFIGTILK